MNIDHSNISIQKSELVRHLFSLIKIYKYYNSQIQCLQENSSSYLVIQSKINTIYSQINILINKYNLHEYILPDNISILFKMASNLTQHLN